MSYLPERTTKSTETCSRLSGYDFQIEYKPGKEIVNADALSRSFLLAFTKMQCTLWSQQQQIQQQDPFCLNKIYNLHHDPSLDLSFSWCHNLLWKDQKLFILADCNLRYKLLFEFHSTSIGGHPGSLRAYSRLVS